jgi:argininosuccinate lyase
MLTLIKGLPMTYNRDLQEDKPPIFDAVKTAMLTANALAHFTPTLKFNKKTAENMLSGGFLEATVIAEYLVEKGLPFRLAHEVSGTLVRIAEDKSITLSEIPLNEMKDICGKIDKDIYKRLEVKNVPNHYRSAGSAGKKEIKKALSRWTRKLK